MKAVVVGVILAVVVLLGSVEACTSDLDCSLLGSCESGACVCDAGWTGTDCAKADLVPWETPYGFGYINETESTWGGMPVKYNAKWQMLATQIEASCPLILFENNSMIVRASADELGGNFTYEEIVLPPFRHNTQATVAPDAVLLFHIGTQFPQQDVLDCRSGLPSCVKHHFCRPSITKSNGQVDMSVAKTPFGPWKTQVVIPFNHTGNSESWNCIATNPTAHVFKNGSVFLVYRANSCKGSGEKLGIATAPHWSSAFTIDPEPISWVGGKTFGNTEDPFVFVNSRGYHLIIHDQSSDNVCGSPDNHGCGSHGYSLDGKTWHMSTSPVYSEEVEIAGGQTRKLLTRQRPTIVFGDDGETPLYLMNGASFEGNNPDLHMTTHTYMWKFNTVELSLPL